MFYGLNSQLLPPLVLILASPFFLLTAIKRRQRRLLLYRKGIAVEGVVIRIEEKIDNDNYTRYARIIGFMTAEKMQVTVTYYSSNLNRGQIIPLLYNAANYKDFIIPSEEKPWLDKIYALIGLGMLVYGIVWFVQ